MKKLAVLGATAIAAGSVALFSAGAAGSDPQIDENDLSVVGEPYGKAVATLRNMGIKVTFGGSRGSALPQAQCLVDRQIVNTSGNMLLTLDCTEKAAQLVEEAAQNGGPRVGSNGVTTVTPTPVGPQPGMPIPAGPQPGMPMPAG